MSHHEKRIAVWSGPRNISTALMRSFENREDTSVLDEPFYAHYLHTTGINHPGKNEILETQKIIWDEIVDYIKGPIPNNKPIWYQKHMAQHNTEGNDLSWTKCMDNLFLIREPEEVIASYYSIFPIDDDLLLGFKQQKELFKYILETTGKISPVINSRTILTNPEKALKKLCGCLDIKFSEKMLKWPPGTRKSDGIWAKYWYKNVINSSGFKKNKKKEVTITSKMQPLVDRCRSSYEYLKQYQI